MSEHMAREIVPKGVVELLCTQGISLREWLKHSFIEVNKVERLQIYKQVVQVVDMAHSQGNALQDIRLSSFILLPSNEIVYFNSSTEHEAVNVIDQNNHGKEKFEQQSDASCQLETLNYGGQSSHFSCGNDTQNNRKSISLGPESCFVTVAVEKNWYACPEELCGTDLLSANIYSLGILLFEVRNTILFRCHIFLFMVLNISLNYPCFYLQHSIKFYNWFSLKMHLRL